MMPAFESWADGVLTKAESKVYSLVTLHNDYREDVRRPFIAREQFRDLLQARGFSPVRMVGGVHGFRLPEPTAPAVDLTRDFTPTAEQISLHGLGFIQVKLEGNQRLHVWHPDVPRRACFAHSAIHNHRFSFRSTVLLGVQVNRRYDVHVDGDRAPTHDLISHDGARSPRGGRLSYVAGQVVAAAQQDEHYMAGCSYIMEELEYHETPNSGVVVTLMQKLSEGTVHASSLIECGHSFDQDFDRFQMSPGRLWDMVLDALWSAA